MRACVRGARARFCALPLAPAASPFACARTCYVHPPPSFPTYNHPSPHPLSPLPPAPHPPTHFAREIPHSPESLLFRTGARSAAGARARRPCAAHARRAISCAHEISHPPTCSGCAPARGVALGLYDRGGSAGRVGPPQILHYIILYYIILYYIILLLQCVRWGGWASWSPPSTLPDALP